MKKTVIYGNGPVAHTAYLKLKHDSPHEVAAFTVDGEYIKTDSMNELPLVPFKEVAELYPPDEYQMLIAVGYVGMNKTRAERYQAAKEMGYQLISHVSSLAVMSPDVAMGDNCMINAQTVVSPLVRIGNDVIIGSGSFIGHDVVIGEHCFIGDRVAIAGGVRIEPYCFLGIGSIIRNKVSVARECLIGAGALILQDTQPREVYMGKQADVLPISSDNLKIG